MLAFERRISNEETYLWGGLAVNAPINSKLILIIQNDENGERIAFGHRKNPGGSLTLGELEPGQSYALNLEGLIGVFAKSLEQNADSFVKCLVTTTN